MLYRSEDILVVSCVCGKGSELFAFACRFFFVFDAMLLFDRFKLGLLRVFFVLACTFIFGRGVVFVAVCVFYRFEFILVFVRF